MKTLQPITTNFGKNLSMLISLIGIRHKEASEQIGISYNTLSNIVNNNFNPSEETINKIESFVTKKGFDKSMLYIVRKPIRNFRIRIKKTLSGNEKATLRNTLIEIEKLINHIDKLENEGTLPIDDFFDLYTGTYKKIDSFDYSERRRKFIEVINEKKRTPIEWAEYFRNPTDIGLWNNFHKTIPNLLECLGIRIHFTSFGTDKVESCSTSIFNSDPKNNTIWTEPSIFINTDFCSTAEKRMFSLAKEFYYMISYKEEYDFLTINDFKLVDSQKETDAELFAMEYLLPKDNIEAEWNYLKNRNKADIVNNIKCIFKVSYKKILKRLSDLGENITEEEYLEALHEDCDKIPYLGDEPYPLPIEYGCRDFYKFVFTHVKNDDIMNL